MFSVLSLKEPNMIELQTLNYKKEKKRLLFKARKMNELILLEVIKGRIVNAKLCDEYKTQLQSKLYEFQSVMNSPMSEFQKFEHSKEYIGDLQDLYSEIKHKLYSKSSAKVRLPQ
eukprot:NODE_512_length_7384_cov_0.221123.p3 type:complete len:115 gc:universal NODE_512_length_7384_cov_0.221123:6879-7223(+)